MSNKRIKRKARRKHKQRNPVHQSMVALGNARTRVATNKRRKRKGSRKQNKQKHIDSYND